MEGLGVLVEYGNVSEERLRLATFICLVIVVLANVVAGFANWQAYSSRVQTQELLAEWRQKAEKMTVRIEALEAAELAKPQQPPPRQQ